MRSTYTDNTITLFLTGRLDSNSSASTESEINSIIEGKEINKVIIDIEGLTYISSAGLRVIMRLSRTYKNLKIIGASLEIYEIFAITGFVELFDIERAYRTISVEGCEVLGRGAVGEVFRIAPDTVVKVYKKGTDVSDINRERELAKRAFVLGLPTAIPYDIVKVGDQFGSVFELLDAESFAQVMIEEPSRTDEMIEKTVGLMKQIHSTSVKHGDLPYMKDQIMENAKNIENSFPPEINEKLQRLIAGLPDTDNMIHGDLQIKNIMIQNGELLLIDMDTLSAGDPILEFAGIFNTYCQYTEPDHDNAMEFLGIPYERAIHIWDMSIHRYLEGRTEEEITEATRKAQLIGCVRIYNSLTRDSQVRRKALADVCRDHILELVPKLESLAL